MDKNLKLVTKLISIKHALNWFKILKKKTMQLITPQASLIKYLC